jgi:hypothetical protein
LGALSFASNALLTTVNIGSGVATITGLKLTGYIPLEPLPEVFDDPSSCGLGGATSYAFNACPKLKEFIVSPSNPNCKSYNKALYTKDGSWLIKATIDPMSINVASGTIGIASEAFSGLKHTTNITLPTTIKYISANAFSGFTTTNDINLPNLEVINWFAFSDFTGNINIGDKLISAGIRVFGSGTTVNINKKASQVRYYKNCYKSFEGVVNFLPE